jgi:2-amino-4-hydroxy-6-hydroxymethyldihydropteridine diphosphokinase
MKLTYLCLGTNLGKREENLRLASAGIEVNIGKVLQYSAVYESEPWGFDADTEFLNMVVKVETKLSPVQLLEEILNIESSIGRIRSDVQYLSRTIDIDILLYEDLIIDEKSLKIPHPLMHERRFVLTPLCDIAPERVHPLLLMSFASILEVCKDNSKVKLYRPQDRKTAGPHDCRTA